MQAKPCATTIRSHAFRTGETIAVSIDTTNGHEAMDYPEHVSTYKLFLRLSVMLVIFCVILLALMGYFLV